MPDSRNASWNECHEPMIRSVEPAVPPVITFSPFPMADDMDSMLVVARQNGGCGCCKGRGKIVVSGIW